jgi:hypothetical protein
MPTFARPRLHRKYVNKIATHEKNDRGKRDRHSPRGSAFGLHRADCSTIAKVKQRNTNLAGLGGEVMGQTFASCPRGAACQQVVFLFISFVQGSVGIGDLTDVVEFLADFLAPSSRRMGR